ncbi:Low-affinity glucose transporter HXT3 [Pseudozyma hubeiensis]|nr:Low-affinity glucose transporter HXT3 [Pseudozyma hubeiensis]
MFVFNTTVHFINLDMRNRAHKPGHDFSREVLQQHHTHEWRDQVPTTAMLAFARVGWSDLLNVYRFCSMAYLSFTAMISLIVLILLLYAVPNQIFLINHVCDIYPGPLPAHCVKDGGFLSNLRLLYRLGLPRNLHGSKYHAFKKMWMVTMVGHSQAVWLMNGAALFLFIPAYLATSPWDKLMHGRSLRNTIDLAFGWVITVAFITAFWITALSATMTLDDIFRAVSGMGEVKTESRANDQETAVQSQISQGRSHVRLMSSETKNAGAVGRGTRDSRRTISFLGDKLIVRQQPSFSGSSPTLVDEQQNSSTSDHSANHTGIRVTIVKETTVS